MNDAARKIAVVEDLYHRDLQGAFRIAGRAGMDLTIVS